MALPPFQKGALVAAAAIFGVESVLVLVGVVVLASTADDDPPEWTGSQVEIRGVLESGGAGRVCVAPTDLGSDVPTSLCGLDVDGVLAEGIEVGDAVIGVLVEVETDPGSGARWRLWSDLRRPPD